MGTQQPLDAESPPDPDDLNVTIGGIPLWIPGDLVRAHRASPRVQRLRERIVEVSRSALVVENGKADRER